MNSLVFNTTADELRTSIYGYNQDTSTLQLLQLNTSGELLIAGDLEITNTMLTISGNVSVSNASLTVAGDVTVSNTLLTVGGNVTVSNASLTVAGDVTVANTLLTVAGDVTITNESLTVYVEGNEFTSNTETFNGVTSTGIAFAATDISQLRTATMFVDNTGTSPITVTLQLSPDGITYFDDPNYSDVVVDQSSYTIMALGIFAQYARIEYDPGTSATFLVHFNGQA